MRKQLEIGEKLKAHALLNVQRNADPDVMRRVSSPAANAIIGKMFPVLNEGFVTLVDYMGGDASIVQAARTSYGSGTKSVRDDEGLIRYLARHRHTTPFEMVEIKLFLRMPISVARQWVRHRTASLNEYSTRYSEVQDIFYLPNVANIQGQSKSNEQGRQEGLLTPEDQETALATFQSSAKGQFATYRGLIDLGVARETARDVLPLSTYTQMYWKTNLHNAFHFLGLRLDPHAQWEIRQYANAVAEIVKTIAPIAYKAFEDFTLNGTSLSNKEMVAISAMLNGKGLEEACEVAGLDPKQKRGEGGEFVLKLEEIKNARR